MTANVVPDLMKTDEDRRKKLVRHRLSKVHLLARGHQIAADRCRAWHYRLGIPVVIFTTIVGTAAFATLNGSTDDPQKYVGRVDPVAIQVVTAIISVFAAILSAMQTFMNFGERTKLHAQASSRFYQLWRRLNRLLLLELESNPSLEKVLEAEEEFNKAVQDAPPLSHSVEEEAAEDIRRQQEEARSSNSQAELPKQPEPSNQPAHSATE